MLAAIASLVAIVGGAPDPDDAAVVTVAHRVVACGDPSPPALECTGTLVGPRLVLTAAHCLGGGPANAFVVEFDAQVIPVVAGGAHPDFDATTHANDLAVLVLGADAPAAIAPVPLRTTPIDATSVGTDVALVGFGVTTGSGTDVGTRTRGTAQISAVDAATISMTPHPAMSCHGDSGGPVLLDGTLIGVTSYGDPACATLGVAMRVDTQQAFIASFTPPTPQATSRAPFDPSAHLCELACTTDDDCPTETECFAQQCVYHGLPAGELGPPCTADATCACVALPDNTACREFHPCTAEPGATCGPLATTGTGCCAASDPTGGLLWLLVLYGANRRSKRASSIPVASSTAAR